MCFTPDKHFYVNPCDLLHNRAMYDRFYADSVVNVVTIVVTHASLADFLVERPECFCIPM